MSRLGCLFHFGQCVWRHVQNNRLSKKYQEDDDFRSNVKKVNALAYLPLDDIIKGFDLVAAEFDDDADEFLGYFEKTWIGEPKRRGKIFLNIQLNILNLCYTGVGGKKPFFDHKLWNIYDRVIADLSRSNNAVEGWHNPFATDGDGVVVLCI